MARYRVIFRACDRVVAFSKRPRPFGLTKRTLVKLSFLSLVDALQGRDHAIQVVGDRLSDDLLRFFARFPVRLSNGELGNAGSLSRCLGLAALHRDEDWIYLCEDDYLHDARAFLFVDDLIENREEYLAHAPKPRWWRLLAGPLERAALCVFLPDYPSRYRAKYRRPSLLFHSRYCHWRQVTHTTWSFISQARQLKRHLRLLERFARTVDDRHMSERVYGGLWLRGRSLCVSPIPGLASHMHEGTMSVVGDWETLCNRYRQKLAELEVSA